MLSTPSTLTELKLHPPLNSGLIGERIGCLYKLSISEKSCSIYLLYCPFIFPHKKRAPLKWTGEYVKNRSDSDVYNLMKKRRRIHDPKK